MYPLRISIALGVVLNLLSCVSIHSAAAAAQDAAGAPEAPAVDEFLKSLKDPSAGNAHVISYALEQSLSKADAAAEAMAQALLDAQSEIAADKAVGKRLDNMTKDGKSLLAAKLLVQIARAKLMVGPQREPTVVVGQLVVDDGKLDPTLVLAQMPILDEGYFASVVGDLKKPLSFRAHGYQDLDVSLESVEGKHEQIIDVGALKFEPVVADQRATLRGRVTLDAAESVEDAVVRLSAAMGPVNTPSNGFSGRMRWPEGLTAPVSKTGEFRVEGLNPSEYSLVVSADGHVDKYQKVQLKPGQELDVEKVRLYSKDLGVYIGAKPPASEELAWETDFGAAAERAKAEGRPIFVMMTASWCGPCKLLEAETLNDPWIRHFLAPYILVKASEDREVEKKYGLAGYPTLIFADDSGAAVHKSVGYVPAFQFAGEVARGLKAAGKELPPEMQALVDKKIVVLK